jgi:glycosyltransferase involved in cell wall biosynthesis
LTYLSGDVFVGKDGFCLPLQLALLWERRSDLQDRFNLQEPSSLQDYLAWGLTEGVAQNAVDPDLLSEAFIEYFCDMSALSARYDDVPITRGMLITQSIPYRQDLLQAGTRFPAEAKGRIAQGLWFAFVAPKMFRWPESLVKPVQAYFQQLTEVRLDGLRLTRGALAVWELHKNLQQSFPLIDEQSVMSYCGWLLFDGLPQLGLTLDDLDPRFRYFLAHRSPRNPDLNRLSEMVHGANPDLHKRFSLTSDADRAALSRWVERSLSTTYPHLVAPQSRRSSLAPDRAIIGLTGLWNSASGRGEDIRCSAKALDAVGFQDYRIIDLSSGQVLYPNGHIAPNRGLHVDINIVHHNADTAMEDWIALRHRDISADRTIGYWAWELEHLPRSWHHAFSFYDEIWAATKFAYRAFYQPRLRSVRLVPMTVTSPQPKSYRKGILNIPDDHTIFLFIFDYRSHIARKNPLAVIEAFARAFPTFKEPTALVIKTLGAEASPSDRQTLEEATAHDSRIRLIDATLNRAEIASLVGSADAFVSLHRSEGFGRGPAEAMLLGVPVIVTDYSGTADFANNQTALTVPYNLIPVSEDDYPGVDGQRWADPDIDVAARHMRFVHDNPLAAKALGARGRKHLRRLYAPKRVGRRMLSVLKLTPDSILTTEPVSAA